VLALESGPAERLLDLDIRHTNAVLGGAPVEGGLMIAAGVNAKALSTYIGHASISITLDRYGHLMPGNEEEAAGLLDAYLTRATESRRIATEFS
jgi:integrase